jgi:uncharacterized protein (DUF1697 family)
MDVVRQLFESIGLADVATFGASGNVVVVTPNKSAKKLKKTIEKRLREALGYEVAVFIRTESALVRIAKYRPFRQSEVNTTAQLNIVFLAEALDERLQRVLALSSETDVFRVHGREICWLRRKRPGAATFSTVPIEKTLSRPSTIRGAQAGIKLVKKYSLKKSSY